MSALRLEQYETIHYEANLNPMGIPESVKKALSSNIANINRYPAEYYPVLKKAVSQYVDADAGHIVLGNGFSDLLRLFVALNMPKKALVLSPSAVEYETVLSIYGCEVEHYELKESEDFSLDTKDFINSLDESLDMVIIGNPNNPTSQIISREDMNSIAAACSANNSFLLIDEMYIEFTENYSALTAVPLTKDYSNIAVLRSVSKFFCVPGLRFAYAVMNNPDNMSIISITSTPNSISVLSAAACIDVFTDESYIAQSRSMIYTERNLIYSAMSTNKNVKLYKPYANYMLVKLLNTEINAKKAAEHCKTRGIILRNCEDFHGLDESYIRFCFMKPKQNDLLVNSILELF